MRDKEVKELSSDTVQGINKAIKKWSKKGWQRGSHTTRNNVTGYHVLMVRYNTIIDEDSE